MKSRWPSAKTSQDWIPQYYGVPYDEVREAWTDWKLGEYGTFYENHPALVWDCLSPFPEDMEQTIDDYYAILDQAEATEGWNADMVTSRCYPEEDKTFDDYVDWRPSLRYEDDDSEVGDGDPGSPHPPEDPTIAARGE